VLEAEEYFLHGSAAAVRGQCRPPSRFEADNTFGLQSLGAAVEMGDAVLGMVIKQLGSPAPAWIGGPK
jgi:hypothetical protein